MKMTLLLCFLFCISTFSFAQIKTWTSADKLILVNNFLRTRAEINEELKNLNHNQWIFKEDSAKWNIAQVVEHLYNWSLITQQNVRYSFFLGENPELAKRVYQIAPLRLLFTNKDHIFLPTIPFQQGLSLMKTT